MKTTKRILSLVLCFVMLVGLMPAITLNADAAETVLDAAIFCSDVHGSTSDLTSVLSGVKTSGVDYSSIGFVGDTCLTVANTTSTVQSALGDTNIAVMFSYAASHDTENSADIGTNWNYSGEVAGVSDYYLVYTIRETDMQSDNGAEADFTTWYSGLTAAQKQLPIFIMSHRPLHARRNDNDGAAAWYDAISAAAESSDIVFFWAHNHTGETSVDTDAYYVAKDGSETFTVQGGDTVTPNFTYMNAGYINANDQNPARINVATTVQITADSLIFQDYNSSGEYSGTYAHNTTVAREFASSTDSGDGGSTEETTAPTEGETTTETKEVYVLVDTLTNNGEYLIVNTNAAGDGYAMNHSSGTEGAVAVSIQESGDYIYIDLDDSTAVWTATTKESGFELMNGSYYLEAYGSTSAIEISTTQAYSGRYWVYDSSASTLGYFGGNGDHYVYYDGGFVSAKNSGSEAVYIYEKQTITVSSDGTVSGGGSTEGGTDEDDTTTGGSTETVVGDGTYTTADDGSYQKVTFGSTTTEKKTVYVLTSSISSGTAYLIANSNSAGSAYVVANNSGEVDATGVTVKTDSEIGTYIELTDATDELWTASGSSSTTLKNGSYYLYPRKKDNGTLELSTSSRSWTYSNNRLSYKDGSTFYLYYSNGWDISTTQNSVYFYVPTEVDATVDSSVTYSVTASDIEHFYTADTTDTETANITASVTDGTPDGTYAYEVMGGDDIITSISEDGVITFNGSEGTAQVKVSYTWTEGENTYTIWQVIDVTATSPYYTLDLHKANVTYTAATDLTEFAEGTVYYTQNEDGTYTQVDTTVTTTPDSSVTYYTLSYTLSEEITAPIAIKGVEEGDRYGVWAVVEYYDGVVDSETGKDAEDMGTVGSDIEWTSSDETIATVDKNTGIITFTGKEGTVTITATYLNGNRPSDSVVISVTQSQYTVPNDGTTDFPEYPNEGAIRYDKTATAVGNFSETGIAQVELSMTGVPYTTGSEIDVVLMLDITGSMTDVTISSYTYSKYARVEYTILATQAFVESIVVNEDGSYNSNRVGVYSFNSGGTYTLFDLGTISSDDELTAAKAAIATLYDDYKSGGTPYDDGLSKVQSVLSAAKTDGTGNNRQQFAVFMTDGVPTDYEYITGTTHANYSSASSIAGMLTSSDNYCTRDTDYYYEYYSTEMKGDGITVYTVGIGLENTNSAWSGTAAQCLNLASRLLNDISGPANETTQPDAVGTSTLSKQDKYFFSVADSDAATEMENVFTNIAAKILQAATDVIVEDQITDYYTMIFDIPTGSQTISGVTNDFYIEFLKYTLDSTTHERVDSDSDGDTYDDATSVTKLYLKNTDGVLSAASDSSGTAYAAPVFEAKIIGDKGTLMFWTTDSSYASKAAVSYNDGTNTYYFIPYGQEINEDGTIPTGWYNMTSGAYAYGTIENYGTEESTNMSTNLVIATPYFVYNAESKMIYWTLDKLQDATTEYALRYFLYLDNSATEVGEEDEVDPGSYLTNDHAYITYTNFQNHDCRQEFPKPQLTWSGAQVSYVFYLVNAAGQPINKSGQVVDFANATFVTDVYTENTVWNKGADGQITADSQLGIEWLAAELLPTDYKVYDEAAYYKLHVYGNHDGTSNFDYFIIDGNEADVISSSLNERLGLYTTESTVSLTTTKVYNTKAGTKITGYGTYASEEAADVDKVLTNFDFYNTTVAFAVVWQPSLAPDTVVVDYGLDVLINVCQNDLMQDNTISGIGLGRDAYGSTAENNGVSTTSKLGTADLTTADGSTISIENDQQIRFSQNDMLFNEPVTFYYESKTEYYEASEKQTGYLHTSVTVIPATTIYYEDEYVELTTYTKQADGTYLESKGWTVNSQDATATQAQDRPGTTLITGVLDANNNYGYDAAYSSMSEYSMGSAAKIIVNSDVEGWADFEFYGTGFDVIATSSNTTGAIVVEVYKVNSNGSYDINSPVKSLTVDTYYGFMYENGEWVTTTENDPNALYQVPVMKIQDLPYAEEDGTPIKYHASILAFYGELFDHTGADQFEFCLDAIRIYDPTGNKNATANEAYKADGEGWPTYEEVRNYVIDAKTFESVATDAVNGIVFIDGIGNTATVSDYNSYGPNNELYLAPGQAITFTLTPGTNVAKIQMALKTVADSAEVEIYTVVDGAKGKVLLDQTISTATDMYYTLWEAVKNTDGTYTQASDMTLVIMNSGEEGVLSITNVKTTYTEAQSEETEPAVAMFMLRRSSVDDALATMNVEEEVPETTVPEETEPETTVPEETEPETTVPETTVPEETEPETTVPEETEPETTVPEETEPSAEEQVQEVVEKVSEIIKKIFGWLFG